MNLDLLDGDAEITDGIRVIVTPGHSPGSQAVLVDTESGLFVIAGDTIAHYVNMEVPKGDFLLARAALRRPAGSTTRAWTG